VKRRHFDIIGLAVVLLLAASSALAGTTAAAADTTAVEATPSPTSNPIPLSEAVAQAQALGLEGQLDKDVVDAPMITSWSRTPSASAKAALRSVTFTGGFDNNFVFRDKSTLSQTGSISHEDFRTKETVSDKRDATVFYRSDAQRALTYDLSLMENWSKEEITNTSGQTTINRRDFKQAKAGIGTKDYELGGLAHDVDLEGSASNQMGEQQNQRNNFSEARLAGAVRSTWEPASWLKLKTGAFTMTESGERSLGVETNPSSANGDSLRAGVGYQRGALIGSVTVRNSNFEKRYLDYNRNANGVIDTIDAMEKIVEELEVNDAVTIEWGNELRFGSSHLRFSGSRDMTQNTYRRSGVGVKERRQDKANIGFSTRLTSLDSIQVSYNYMWGWNNQTYRGATAPRGRQVTTSTTVKAFWLHDLFESTDMMVNLSNGISQDIAENTFNQNDRDRIDTTANLKLRTNWDNGVTVDLVFDARRVEDVSIRSSRSANNSIKDTYEISPAYSWPITSWLDLNQSFRVWIQYTDYVFSDLEEVNKQDDFNRRGNLETKFTLRPNRRLRLTLRYNYSVKLNGEKVGNDAAGNTYYFFESDQRINKLDVSMAYTVNKWFALEGTTYSGRDLKESYGDRAGITDRYSGDVGVGCSIDKKFGAGRSLKLGVRKIYAYGPSVRDEGKDYWDADLQLTWGF